MRLWAVPSSADCCSPRLPHSSLCPPSSPSFAREALDTTSIRRNPMSHEDVLDQSQEQPSTPSAASLPGTGPAGKHSRLLLFLIIPLALCLFELLPCFINSL